VKRILLVWPRLRPPGGGQGLTAWLIHGLLENTPHSIELACLEKPDVEALDTFFDTRLTSPRRSLVVHQAPASIGFVIRGLCSLGLRCAALEMALLERWVQALTRRRGRFDLYVSTCNEWQFPGDAPALWYIHYPRYHPERGVGELRWFHRFPGVLWMYRSLCRTLAGHGHPRMASLTVLANSKWTAQRFREAHGFDAEVVHPPTPGEVSGGERWQDRANRFVMVGRLSPEKRIPEVVSILERVRRSLTPSRSPSLHIIGSWDSNARFQRRLEDLFSHHRDWIRLSIDPPRQELSRILRTSRYGIHGMTDEHFGMAVAEMQRAGCVAFVPSTGGPREIVGDEPRQIYDSDDEAVEKISSVLQDQRVQLELAERAVRRQDLFSTGRFVKECLDRVAGLFQDKPQA